MYSDIVCILSVGVVVLTVNLKLFFVMSCFIWFIILLDWGERVEKAFYSLIFLKNIEHSPVIGFLVI